MSGSVIKAGVLFASATGSTTTDSSLLNGQVLDGIDSYGTAGTPTVYVVDSTIGLNVGPTYDAGSFSTLDFNTAASVSLLTTFDVGAKFTAPDGTKVPAGNGTLEFGASALSVGVGSTIVMSGNNDTVIIDSGNAVPAPITGFSGTSGDQIIFKTSAFVAGETYKFMALGTSGFYVGNTLEQAVNLGNIAASKAMAVSNGSGGTIIEAVCFMQGTRIETPLGQTTVEALRAGDLVATRQGDKVIFQPVKWMGHRRIDLSAHPRAERVAPVRIQRGAFADNVPHADLLVSPDHAIFVDGKLICARQLINNTTITQELRLRSVDYFHVELDAHAILVAEGLLTESYLDTGNRGFFGNSSEPMILFPDLTDESDCSMRESASCAPFVWDEESVRPVWERLAGRASAMGLATPVYDTTSEPDLRVVVNGRALAPVSKQGARHTFVLPKDVTEVHVASRAAMPTDARPWMEDRRQLGVYVERIVVRSGHDLFEVPLDHGDLAEGWWDAEQISGELRRWTDGHAVLPLPLTDHLTVLDIYATNSGMSYATESRGERHAA
jgi:hypothetical protein